MDKKLCLISVFLVVLAAFFGAFAALQDIEVDYSVLR